MLKIPSSFHVADEHFLESAEECSENTNILEVLSDKSHVSHFFMWETFL